ncbi:MAG: 30S ribosome-binding factor RbfA [Oscillospiraceae bacterium]|jgi:ribosome-binding factor A|nr:30S ribosome-binding factor RbfA [Oscillospiraceae bacterium]
MARIERVNEDVQRALSSLLREIKDPRINQGMLSVTGAEVTGDLKYCRVRISVLGLTSEKELMKGLKSASGFIRRELASRVKLRQTPELVFELDRSIEHGAHINSIIAGLDIKPEEPESPGSTEAEGDD